MTHICTMCGYVGYSKKITRGSFLMEVLLWLLFIFPGLIYSVWRQVSKYKACPMCKNATMIPLDSPVGRQLREERRAEYRVPAGPHGYPPA